MREARGGNDVEAAEEGDGVASVVAPDATNDAGTSSASLDDDAAAQTRHSSVNAARNMTPSKRIVPHFPKPRRIARGSRRKGTAARHARMAECRDARRCRSRGNINRRETTFFRAPRRAARHTASHRAMAPTAAETRAAEIATGVPNDKRFILELEFVMALANPRYVHRARPPAPPASIEPHSSIAKKRPSRARTDLAVVRPRPPSLTRRPSPRSRRADLAVNDILDDPAFVAYLDYLSYWTRPEYARFVQYPHALYFLEQLEDPAFRAAMRNPRACEHVFAAQYYHWQNARTDRANAKIAAEAAAAAAGGGGGGGGGREAAAA